MIEELAKRDLLKFITINNRIFENYRNTPLWNDWVPDKASVELNEKYNKILIKRNYKRINNISPYLE